MTRLTAAVAAVALLCAAAPASAPAQERPERVQPIQQPQAPQVPAVRTFEDSPTAHQTRELLQRLLRQYPPAVGEVLQRDPSLLNRQDYLAPYPALVAFLAQHPEVARNPSYFLGQYDYYERGPRERAVDVFGNLLQGIVVGTVFAVVVSLLVWLVRAAIDHRRWLRQSRVQTEVHTKLMDRLTSNEDLLAYIQSPVGRRFLESAPIALDGEPRPTSAPVSRILWSLQAGIVLIALGVGFWFARQNVLPEVADGFYVLGVIAIALGAGFAVSAFASYFISTRLGLMPARKPAVDA